MNFLRESKEKMMTRPQRSKLLMPITLTLGLLAGGLAATSAAGAEAAGDPAPPPPPWVNSDGTLNQAKMPETIILDDANGNAVKSVPFGPGSSWHNAEFEGSEIDGQSVPTTDTKG